MEQQLLGQAGGRSSRRQWEQAQWTFAWKRWTALHSTMHVAGVKVPCGGAEAKDATNDDPSCNRLEKLDEVLVAFSAKSVNSIVRWIHATSSSTTCVDAFSDKGTQNTLPIAINPMYTCHSTRSNDGK